MASLQPYYDTFENNNLEPFEVVSKEALTFQQNVKGEEHQFV